MSTNDLERIVDSFNRSLEFNRNRLEVRNYCISRNMHRVIRISHIQPENEDGYL